MAVRLQCIPTVGTFRTLLGMSLPVGIGTKPASMEKIQMPTLFSTDTSS
jgi:hypothetical protein